MGWDSSTSWTKKSDAVKEETAELLRDGFMILDQVSTRSGVFWAVQDANGVKHILCMKVQKRKSEVWVKHMDESMGPAMLDCPLRFFDLVPVGPGYAAKWRQDVRDYHARSALDLIGQTIELWPNGPRYYVDGRSGRSYLVTRDDGKRFRLTAEQAKTCKIILPDLRTAVQSALNTNSEVIS